MTREIVIMSQSKPRAWRIVLVALFLLLAIIALVGASISTGPSDVTVGDAYSSILRKPFPDHFESKYIFTWNDVPGSDGERLLHYLMDEYGIGGTGGAGISKSGDGRTITIADGKNSATITLDGRDSENAELKIAGGRSVSLKIREKNGEIGIHESTWLADVCVWNLILPRIFLAILAGIALGLAGGIMQWALKNPLASPYTLGISSVAACGASFAVIFGFGHVGGKFGIIGVAFIFTLIATAIILYTSSRGWVTPKRVALIGITIVLIDYSGAMIALFRQFGAAENVKEVTFFLIGNLNLVSWDVLAYMADILVFCVILLLLLLFIPSLFDVADKRIRTSAMVVASLLVATTVCFTGLIGFIGLLAPHICRLAIGDDHRFVIPVSGLVGVILLLGSDLVARTVISPLVMPVGKVTVVMGVPFLVYHLLRKGTRKVGSA